MSWLLELLKSWSFSLCAAGRGAAADIWWARSWAWRELSSGCVVLKVFCAPQAKRKQFCASRGRISVQFLSTKNNTQLFFFSISLQERKSASPPPPPPVTYSELYLLQKLRSVPCGTPTRPGPWSCMDWVRGRNWCRCPPAACVSLSGSWKRFWGPSVEPGCGPNECICRPCVGCRTRCSKKYEHHKIWSPRGRNWTKLLWCCCQPGGLDPGTRWRHGTRSAGPSSPLSSAGAPSPEPDPRSRHWASGSSVPSWSQRWTAWRETELCTLSSVALPCLAGVAQAANGSASKTSHCRAAAFPAPRVHLTPCELLLKVSCTASANGISFWIDDQKVATWLQSSRRRLPEAVGCEICYFLLQPHVLHSAARRSLWGITSQSACSAPCNGNNPSLWTYSPFFLML